MADTYQNYAELSAAEQEGVDYRIQSTDRDSKLIVLAIHGGGIEGGTSELTTATAQENASTYLFEGIKSSGNSTLHITSTRFDEPSALELVPQHDYALAYHGYGDNDHKHTLVGGADHDLKQQVYNALTEAGFSAEILPEEDPLSGASPNNIVNKVRTGKGVQLELSTAQRKAFFENFTTDGRKGTETEEFYSYVDAIQSVYNSLD